MTNILRYTIDESLFCGCYTATVLSSELDNCHGQGSTPAEALVVLKLAIRARRRNAARANGHDCINDTYFGRITEKMVQV